MKLNLVSLRRFIDLPWSSTVEIRRALDLLGLEVKDVEETAKGPVFNIETLANRGDHLSVLGVARELSASVLSSLRVPAMSFGHRELEISRPVRISSAKCLRYSLWEFDLPEVINPPREIQAEVELDEQTPLMVSLLNFIQQELGQPMHAFDRDKLKGEIFVKELEDESEFLALDLKTYRVPKGALVICDEEKILAVAGVIGGASSMVGCETLRFSIESATFDPVSVRITARAMGISTDASYLFERGADLATVAMGLGRLEQVFKSAGAVVNPLGFAEVQTVDALSKSDGVSAASIARALGRKVSVQSSEFSEHLGESVAGADVRARLEKLAYEVLTDGADYCVLVPSHRHWDVFNADDVVEDFVRSYGMDNVKRQLPELKLRIHTEDKAETFSKRLPGILTARGFTEVMTSSFISTQELKTLLSLDPKLEKRHVGILNAVESKNSHLRLTNVNHLASLAAYNLRHGAKGVKVFERTQLFDRGLADGKYEHEREVLSLFAYGSWYDNEWRKQDSSRETKLALFKDLLETLVLSSGNDLESAGSSIAWLHPAAQAELTVNGKTLGYYGLLHPLLEQQYALEESAIYAELDLPLLCEGFRERKYQEINRFPSVYRDITVGIPLKSRAEEKSLKLKSEGIANLKAVSIVDDFTPAGALQRQLTYRLEFQGAERTLEQAEVDSAMERVREIMG